MGRFTDFILGPNLTQTRDADQRDNSKPLPGVIPPDRSGSRTVDTKGALSIAAVYRAVSILTTAASQLTLKAYAGAEENTSPPLVVRQPDTHTTLPVFLEQTVSSLACTGNAYWLISRDSKGVVNNLQVLNPGKVEPTADEFGNSISFKYNGKDKTYSTDEIRHLKLLRIPGEVKGLGPIQSMMAALRGVLDTEQYAANWTANTIPSGLLKSDQNLEPEAAAEARKRWNETAGSGKGVAVLGSGLDYTPIFLTPDQLQFISVRQFNITEVARMFGIEASLLLAPVEGSNLTYQNIEQAWIAMVRFGLMQYLKEIETAFSDLLPRAQTVRFNIDALLRPDTAARYAAHQIGINAGFLTPDEVRAIEGRPALTAEQTAQILALRQKAPGTAADANSDSSTTPEQLDAEQARYAAETIQKVYLGVGKVLTADEARDIATRAGAQLHGSFVPVETASADTPPADDSAS